MEEVSKTPNKGKRKIPIEPITNKTRKQVTFSKRRGGLFKKGSELCSLCGANVAIITFSGAGKLFGFGHPSAEAVVQRYINNSTKNNKIKFNQHFGNNNDGDNNNYNYDYGKFSKQYKDIIDQIEAEKRASSSTNINNNNVNNDNGNLFWWDNINIDELKLVELEQFKVALEGLRNDVICRVDEINQSSMCYVPQNFGFGTRDGNIVAHCQGFDEFTTYWADHHEMGRENLHQVPLAADSVLDMVMLVQKADIF